MTSLPARLRHYQELSLIEQNYHLQFMQQALEQAQAAFANDEVPIGCVIVSPNDTVVGVGQNRTRRAQEVLAHAEVEALKQATTTLGDFRLDGCRCYVTVEPCLMCLGALLHARITSVHFGVGEPKFGAVYSRFRLLEHERFSKFEFVYGYLADEISRTMSEFFQQLRHQS